MSPFISLSTYFSIHTGHRARLQTDPSSFQEQWCSLVLLEDLPILWSTISLHEPQLLQDLTGSGSFSSFYDDQ